MMPIPGGKAASFAFPGLNISLIDKGSFLTGFLADLLDRWGESNTESGLPLQVRSFPADQWSVELPEWLVERTSHLHPTDDIMIPAHVYYGPTGSAVVVVTPKERHVAFWDQQTSLIAYHSFSDQEPENPFSSGPIQMVMKPLLREILAARGHYMLHAAAIMSAGGMGALLVGQGGAGKTTTALSIVRLGGRIISDDTVTVSSQGETVMAHRWMRSFHITEKTSQFFKELSPFPSPDKMVGYTTKVPDPLLGTVTGVGGKKLLFGQELKNIYNSNCVTESCQIEAIYCLKLTPGTPEVFEAPVTKALSKLTAAHTFASGQRMTPGAAKLLTDLIDQGKVFNLHTGSDPEKTGQKLKDHLGQLTAVSGRIP